MLKYQWECLTISTESHFRKLQNIVNDVKPTVGAMDTETSGLHIILDKPFVIQFGFLDEKRLRGFTFALDLENTNKELQQLVLNYWSKEALKLKVYAGHNIKFDLHMLYNINHPYSGNNLTDTQFFIRYAHDALHPEEGGPPLGLKEYATRYIDPNAKLHEHKLKKEQSNIAKLYNTRLKVMLNKSGAKLPEGIKAKSFTMKVFNNMFKDCTLEVSDLPDDIKEVYLEWYNSLPLHLQQKVNPIVESDMIRYNDLDRENLIKYSHYDIIYTLEIYASLKDIVKHRHQETAIAIENQCILPWFTMERQGFLADKPYLEECRLNLKKYIRQQREKFYTLAGKKVSIGQHEEIKKILKERYNIEAASSGNEALSLIANNTDNKTAKEFITRLQELRTLEKWYAVYILRFQKDLKHTNKLYTTINQVGTVSGRVTSDFQQFPKKPIRDEEGNELFHPRRLIKTNSALVYLDYSQIELRFQALYTIMVGHPDMNLCRAYMPFKCHKANGEPFDTKNYEHISKYKEFKWYHNEDNTEWEPVDVHGATTLAAFPNLKKTDPEYHDIRYIGKRVNFAKNYGAELSRIKQMFPDRTHEECVRINDAYYKAFPGIKEYHKYCNERAINYSHTTNLLGVNYYNVSGHKLKNLLIQGSAAFYLKLKIIELYNFTKQNNIKSKLQMQIHDELSWEYNPEDPPEVFFAFKKIMEDWKGSQVPVIADMEVSTTTWAEKKEVETIEELKEYINEIHTYTSN